MYPCILGELGGGDLVHAGMRLKPKWHRAGAGALLDIYCQEAILDLMDPAPHVGAIRKGGIDSFAVK